MGTPIGRRINRSLRGVPVHYPTIVAHSYTVTTDVGLVAFTALPIFAIWRYVQNPSLRMLACCGLALGAALCAKFSAVLLIPVIGVLLIAAVKWPPEQDPGRQAHAA